MTNRKRLKLCKKNLEMYWNYLSLEGKQTHRDLVQNTGLDPIEAMDMMLTQHQDMFVPKITRLIFKEVN